VGGVGWGRRSGGGDGGDDVGARVRLPYVLIFPDMSSFSKLKLPSGRNS
jgi:hypothetical protein